MGRDTLIVMVQAAAIVFACIIMFGCGTRPPCMTGFETGIGASKQYGDIPDFDSTYVGWHATIYYDTTGACGPYEE